MNKHIAVDQKSTIRRWMLWGIPLLFFAGCLMHIVYEWSGNSAVAGIFAPVNESVWEHLKMAFWPMLAYFLLGYFVLRNKTDISVSKWFCACAAAIAVAPAVIVTFYYTYTGALGIASVLLDVFSLLLAIAAAQILALHIYIRRNPRPGHLYVCIAVIMLIGAAFVIFTFAPPRIPLFRDVISGDYGI